MSPPSADRFFGGRLTDQYGDHYYLIFSIFKGVVLASAAVTLLAIFVSNESGSVKATGLALWLGAFGNVICTYNALMVNSMMIAAPPNLIDVVNPFVLGLLEFAHFAVLIPLATDLVTRPSSADQLAHMQWWFLVFVAISVTSVITLANLQLQLTTTAGAASDDIAPMLQWCKAALRKGQIGVGSATLVIIAFFLLIHFGFPHVGFLGTLPRAEQVRKWQGVLGLVFAIGVIPAVLSQERARLTILAVASGDTESPTQLDTALTSSSADGPATGRCRGGGYQSGLTGSPSVGRQYLRKRLTDQYAHHYHLIVSVFKGLALSSGAVTLLAIISSQAATSVKLTASALWLASLTVVIATYDGIMVGSIMITAPPNSFDVVVPFVLGLAEYSLFAVLSPLGADLLGRQPATAAQLQHLTWWPLVFAIVTFTAGAAITSSKRRVRITMDQSPEDVQPLLRWYVKQLTQDQVMTAASVVSMLLAFMVFHYGPAPLRAWQGMVAPLVVVAMVNATLSQERTRRRIGASVGVTVAVDDQSEVDGPGVSGGPTRMACDA